MDSDDEGDGYYSEDDIAKPHFVVRYSRRSADLFGPFATFRRADEWVRRNVAGQALGRPDTLYLDVELLGVSGDVMIAEPSE